MMKHNFKLLSRERLQEIQRKGVETSRSPELKRAWAEQNEIRNLYKSGVPVKVIAKWYEINVRSCYRIIKL